MCFYLCILFSTKGFEWCRIKTLKRHLEDYSLNVSNTINEQDSVKRYRIC